MVSSVPQGPGYVQESREEKSETLAEARLEGTLSINTEEHASQRENPSNSYLKYQVKTNWNKKIRPKTFRHGDYQEELAKYGLIYLVSSCLKKKATSIYRKGYIF